MTSEPTVSALPPPLLPRRSSAYVAGAVVVGIGVGRVIPPPVPDGQWWASYLLSPGFGGTAALAAALFAGGVALRNSAKDRAQRHLADLRSQWWNRFTWATEKAIDPATSVVGSRVLTALVIPGLATVEDARMAIAVSEMVVPPQTNGRKVRDDGPQVQRRGSRRRT
ncbi:MAG: hypothetical protein IJO71_12065 [Microbacterium sp.]|uniref:hypothetical protein n=1 Tax=Microbacterium sp. TaxID=51671 RepID=UPI0025DBD19A|nr:hypothetical protein [Microbacterium sp.]MBQ9917916.1 hypothetical protein [Microbacterium sp.]